MMPSRASTAAHAQDGTESKLQVIDEVGRFGVQLCETSHQYQDDMDFLPRIFTEPMSHEASREGRLQTLPQNAQPPHGILPKILPLRDTATGTLHLLQEEWRKAGPAEPQHTAVFKHLLQLLEHKDLQITKLKEQLTEIEKASLSGTQGSQAILSDSEAALERRQDGDDRVIVQGITEESGSEGMGKFASTATMPLGEGIIGELGVESENKQRNKGGFKVGDLVRFRNADTSPWYNGTVSEVEQGRPKMCKPCPAKVKSGPSKPSFWNEFEHIHQCP